MRQLPLPLAHRASLERAAFLESPANAAALAAVGDWRAWPGRRLAIAGPEAAGKSHLAAIWAADAGARVIGAEALGHEDPVTLAAAPLAIEDAERALPGRPGLAAALFHALNAFSAAGQWLLITGRTPPARWQTGLPDLASRLAALPLARLEAPDDALLAALLAKHFHDRQLAVPDALIPYLVRRMERSASAAAEIAARIDAAALAEGAVPGTGFARRILGW